MAVYTTGIIRKWSLSIKSNFLRLVIHSVGAGSLRIRATYMVRSLLAILSLCVRYMLCSQILTYKKVEHSACGW